MESLALPDLDGQSNARLRFRLQSDASVVADGWYLDDLHLRGVSDDCLTETPPTAAFNAPAQALQDIPVDFTNLSTGSIPLAYDWDFGDGLGASDLREPNYAFPNPGDFTVSLTVSNILGEDSQDQTITVVPAVHFYLPLVNKTQP